MSQQEKRETATEPEERGTSAAGSAQAELKLPGVEGESTNDLPMEQISLNVARSQDPDQPEAAPGSGDVEP
jgi:hypothetical protein